MNTCKSSLIRPLTPEAKRNAIGQYRYYSVFICDNCGKMSCEACGGFGFGFGFGLIGRRCSCGGSSISVTAAYKK